MTASRIKLSALVLLSLLVSPIMIGCDNAGNNDEAVEESQGNESESEEETEQGQTQEEEEEGENESEND